MKKYELEEINKMLRQYLRFMQDKNAQLECRLLAADVLERMSQSEIKRLKAELAKLKEGAK